MRPLNNIEQAFTYTNEVNPLCVVIVLRLRNTPSGSKLREALDALQRRHVLLRCGIEKDRGRYAFLKMDPPEPIPLRRANRHDSNHWEAITEEALNTRFDATGPLLRMTHLVDDSERSELILVLHHAVMDGTSARLLLHELLHLWNDMELPPPPAGTLQVATHSFPENYRGRRLPLRLVPFMARQVWSELSFARNGIGISAARSPHNRVLHLSIPADASRRIGLRIGREGLSVNTVTNAALLSTVRKKLHAEDSRNLMRAISFADLRTNLLPEPGESVLGCMISMIRVSVPVEVTDDLLTIARRLRREMFIAGKSGEHFLFAVSAKHVTRLALRLRRGRIANSAVSFLGKLNLEPRYGSTELDDVHAFITNNVVGPELSAFGKILFGRIELDLTYLSSEISETVARELLSELEVSLLSLGR